MQSGLTCLNVPEAVKGPRRGHTCHAGSINCGQMHLRDAHSVIEEDWSLVFTTSKRTGQDRTHRTSTSERNRKIKIQFWGTVQFNLYRFLCAEIETKMNQAENSQILSKAVKSLTSQCGSVIQWLLIWKPRDFSRTSQHRFRGNKSNRAIYKCWDATRASSLLWSVSLH